MWEMNRYERAELNGRSSGLNGYYCNNCLLSCQEVQKHPPPSGGGERCNDGLAGARYQKWRDETVLTKPMLGVKRI
jgi:hypothetical protein